MYNGTYLLMSSTLIWVFWTSGEKSSPCYKILKDGLRRESEVMGLGGVASSSLEPMTINGGNPATMKKKRFVTQSAGNHEQNIL